MRVECHEWDWCPYKKVLRLLHCLFYRVWAQEKDTIHERECRPCLHTNSAGAFPASRAGLNKFLLFVILEIKYKCINNVVCGIFDSIMNGLTSHP